ncbi:hypothetical protein [Mucilaginibacter sp. OK283]|uniref:hypothetical protein n=1 Tax=Mucilaginibacter sp. OK283 TaxID=1881049 RepID=UPI0008BDA21D|nr:hypothetical protein [Mucilaginibacter sp. OK283]SEP35196.1 hypothetical protein SAMN05428947_1122 [Mucilaginibacter sp. OK283]
MKKLTPRFFIVFIFIVLYALVGFENIEGLKYQNDVKAANLKGKVKSCISYYYPSQQTGINIISGWQYYETRKYRMDGKIESSLYVDSVKVKQPRFGLICSYDREGRQLTKKNIRGELLDSSIYKTNKQGQLEEYNYSGVTVYNKQGLFQAFYINMQGARILRHADHYDKQGHVIESLQYGEDGKPTETIKYKMDALGRKIIEETYDPQNTLTLKISYTYDDHDNVIIQKDSSVTDATYVGGFVAHGDLTPDSKVTQTLSRYSRYDKHGNWLLWDILYKGKVVKTVKRRIAYYKD